MLRILNQLLASLKNSVVRHNIKRIRSVDYAGKFNQFFLFGRLQEKRLHSARHIEVVRAMKQQSEKHFQIDQYLSLLKRNYFETKKENCARSLRKRKTVF